MRVELAGVGDADDHAELLRHLGLGGGRLHAAEFQRRALVLVEIGQDRRGLHGLRRELAAPNRHAPRPSLRPPARRPRHQRAGDAVVGAHAGEIALHDLDHCGLARADRRVQIVDGRLFEAERLVLAFGLWISSGPCTAHLALIRHVTPRISSLSRRSDRSFRGYRRSRITLSSAAGQRDPSRCAMKKLSLGVAFATTGAYQPGGRAGLSDAPDHVHRALWRGRAGRHAGPHDEPSRCGRARPARHDRERRRRERHHRRRPRGAARPDGYTVSIGNWPSHITNGAIYNLNYDIQKDLDSGRAPAAQPVHRRRAQGFSGEGLQGVDRLAQGQPGQGDRGHRRPGLRPAHQRRLFPEDHRHANSSSCRTSPAPPTSSATSWRATSTSPSIRPSPRCRISRAAT